MNSYLSRYVDEEVLFMKGLAKNSKFWIILISDTFLLVLSYLLSCAVRFLDGIEFFTGEVTHLALLFFIIPLKLVVFYFFGLYRGMWRYTSYSDIINVFRATLFSTLFIVTVILFINRFEGVSRSILVIDFLFTFFLIGGNRALIRYLLRHQAFNSVEMKSTSFSKFGTKKKENERKKLLIVGAGSYAEKIIREIKENEALGYSSVGLVDDDPAKIGMKLHGIPVCGPIEDIGIHILQCGAEEIVIAISSITAHEMQRIVQLCQKTEVPFKILPGIGQLIDGRVSVKKMRDVAYADLLGREQVELNQDEVRKYLKGRVVLVTGAGGSIGAELCRQIIRFKPSLLLLFDAGEENLYNIQMELLHELSFTAMIPTLGRVQDIGLLHSVFKKYTPHVVFHAAAYKHVPLIEENPCQAVHNNIFASQLLIEAAIIHNVERFVIVSTDKAVRPTNVMGASKRVTELLMQAYSNKRWNGIFSPQHCKYAAKQGILLPQSKHSTNFMAVRFGNVLGSSGSVIPLFKRQIARGGPITVTHPEVVRYFMAIPEAAQLILQAGSMGNQGEIFILKMGKPIKIVNMARDLIRLAGKEGDIEIVFTGLRSGEKMYEELITEGEGIVETNHKQIMVLRRDADFIDLKKISIEFENLLQYVRKNDATNIRKSLSRLVPEFESRKNNSECYQLNIEENLLKIFK